MATFKDYLGREWELRITRAHVPKLREIGFDLNAMVKDPTKLEAMDDPDLMGKVLWVLCEKQAEKHDLTPEAFAEAFDGPTYFAAQDAFGAAYLSFCQRPAIAKAMTEKTLGEMGKTEALMVEAIKQAVIRSGSNGSSPNTAESAELKAST